MVRKLGVSHKSLLVPNVSAGTYSIRYEHEDYFDRNFNITVGSGLPTTFSEAMVEKVYAMSLEFPSTTLLTNDTITEGSEVVFNSFTIRNSGNVDAYAWYTLEGAGISVSGIDPLLLSPGLAVGISVPNETPTVTVGDHPITLHAGPSTSGTFWAGALPYTDERVETLHILEWSTDITFIATAPGISDLHGVRVFIDNVDMGVT